MYSVHAFHCSSCACRRCSLALGASDRRRRLLRDAQAAVPPSTSLGSPSTARDSESRMVNQVGTWSRGLRALVAFWCQSVSQQWWHSGVSQPASSSEWVTEGQDGDVLARKLWGESASQSQRNESQEPPVKTTTGVQEVACAQHTQARSSTHHCSCEPSGHGNWRVQARRATSGQSSVNVLSSLLRERCSCARKQMCTRRAGQAASWNLFLLSL